MVKILGVCGVHVKLLLNMLKTSFRCSKPGSGVEVELVTLRGKINFCIHCDMH